MLLTRNWLCLEREKRRTEPVLMKSTAVEIVALCILFFSFHSGTGALPTLGILRTCQSISTFPVFRNKYICLVLYLSTTAISALKIFNEKGLFSINCNDYFFILGIYSSIKKWVDTNFIMKELSTSNNIF